jgi:hypothetical protein
MKRLVLLWAVSLVLVAMTTLAIAQNRFAEPQMVSGNDIAFRVQGTDISGRAYGTWLVRLNGNWIEIGANITTRPATN